MHCHSSPIGHGFLAVLEAGVEGIQLVMSSCEQDLEQAAPLLNLPYMQHPCTVAIQTLLLCYVPAAASETLTAFLQRQVVLPQAS